MTRRLRCLAATVVFASSLCVPSVLAEDIVLTTQPVPEESCASGPVSAKPTRPNFSYSTETTQCGVVEVDYGWTRQWPGAGEHQDFFSSGFRVGITPALDFRWGADNYISDTTGGTSVSGTGDNWLGARYRFHDQSALTPALGLVYSVKVPTASALKGLGSGYVDHAFTLIASKDFGKYHFDFNAVSTLADAPAGFGNGTVFSLACSRPLTRRLTVVGESYGGSQPDGGRHASVLVGTAYSVSPKLVLDSAIESGVAGSAPRKRLLLGATCAIGHISSLVRSRAVDH